MTADDQKHTRKASIKMHREPEYPSFSQAAGEPFLTRIKKDMDHIRLDDQVDLETILNAAEEILKRKHFWDKYALLKSLEVRFRDEFADLKKKLAISDFIKRELNTGDLSMVENGDQEFDLEKVEALVHVVKREQIKEDVLRGAIPLLLSDKENEVLSPFYRIVKRIETVSDPRIIVSCIDGMLFMTHGLENQLDHRRMETIREMAGSFLQQHTTPFSVKNAFEYAKRLGYVYFMAAVIRYIGETIDKVGTGVPQRIIDIVRAVDFNIADYVSDDIDFSDIVDESIIRKLVRFGRISVACKLAHHYGLMNDPAKEELYHWLLRIYSLQHDKFKRVYKSDELADW